MKLYFVTVGIKAEIEAIREEKPTNLLCSYFYFKNKNLGNFIEQLGYAPKIMLDSGAYSVWTKGKNISIIDYMDYIEENKECIENYIALDVFQDAEMSMDYYKIMLKRGLNPIPVYHYATEERYLKEYIDLGAKYIALGGTVPIADKNVVARWVHLITEKYPDIKFHLLGSNSRKITQYCDLESVDSSTWIMKAIMGQPETITGRGTKANIERAKFNLKLMGEQVGYKQLKMF